MVRFTNAHAWMVPPTHARLFMPRHFLVVVVVVVVAAVVQVEPPLSNLPHPDSYYQDTSLNQAAYSATIT